MCIRDRHKGSKATPEQIRSSFDAEIAFLMTFFKMSIDSRVINAAVLSLIHILDVLHLSGVQTDETEIELLHTWDVPLQGFQYHVIAGRYVHLSLIHI